MVGERDYYPGKICLKDSIKPEVQIPMIEITKEILSQNKMILEMNSRLLNIIHSPLLIVNTEQTK